MCDTTTECIHEWEYYQVNKNFSITANCSVEGYVTPLEPIALTTVELRLHSRCRLCERLREECYSAVPISEILW